MSLTDMALRSYRGAMGLHDTLTRVIKPALTDAIEAMTNFKATMGAVREFGKDQREDIAELIRECEILQTGLALRLEQMMTVLDIVIHVATESADLSQQTGERLQVAAGHLTEAEEESADHIQLTSNFATLTGNLDHVYSDPVRLRRVLALADQKAIEAILGDMGYKVKPKGRNDETN